MANLYSLIHDLRERIAATSTTTSTSSHSSSYTDPVEARFRIVLADLLRAYVPSSSSTCNERDITAVLKLVSYTARNFPGAFYHGKASAVLPVVARILPFLADPAFCSWHVVIFETLTSVLSLLRYGDREVYHQFFLDAMELVEDILDVTPGGVTLRCFTASFGSISSEPSLFGELPVSCLSVDGNGISIDLADMLRWKLFAGWMIKLVSKCLTEGTLYVEGICYTSFVTAACSLLHVKDAALHMACYDFARIAATVIVEDIVPVENIIRSIACILSQDDKELKDFRSTAYDTSLGACLHVLHSACSNDSVMSTAFDIVDIFPKSLHSTESLELQAALCNAYIRIVKICPMHIWIHGITNMFSFQKPCLLMIECIRVAVIALGFDYVGDKIVNAEELEIPKVGNKRSTHDNINIGFKRQKIYGVEAIPVPQLGNGANYISRGQQENQVTNNVKSQLIEIINSLKPNSDPGVSCLKPEIAIVSLSMLCIALHGFSDSCLSGIFHQLISWITWIHDQEKNAGSFTFSFSIYLDAVHCMFLKDFNKELIIDEILLSNNLTKFDLIDFLKLAWSDHSLFIQTDSIQKIKCLSIRIFSMISHLHDDTSLDLLDMALQDDDEEVQIESIASMPVIVLYSGIRLLVNMFDRLKTFGINGSERVKKSIILSFGYLACLYGSSNAVNDQNVSSCKLFVGNNCGRDTASVLSRGFWCSQCNTGLDFDKEQYLPAVELPKLQDTMIGKELNSVNLQSFFLQFLYSDLSDVFGVVCVKILPRIVRHASRDILLKTRLQWIECIDFLLLHDVKAVREAFSLVISCFIESQILDILFNNDNTYRKTNGKTKEQKFLDRIKHALVRTDDPEIFVTLLETISEIMIASDIPGQLFFYSLILFVDQLDNKNEIVRKLTSKLILRSCSVELILSKFIHIRDELLEYLCSRLVSRPVIIKTFAECVGGISIEELTKRMVPYVIPKLVVSFKDNNQAIVTLYEIANILNTEAIPLIVDLSPKVLAFALLGANKRDLSSVLEFYQVHASSDSKEIFAAALPALLDELLCFHGEENMDDTEERTARIPTMIQEVAKILTDSDDLSEFLKNHFVRLLNSIDRKMLHSKDLSLQKQALRRIQKLIEMMGSNLSTHVPKIMVLLLHAIEKESLQSDGLVVLHYFVNQLATISPSSNKHVISQVVAAFIPSLEKCVENPSLHLKKIVEILEDLIVRNKFVLKQHIRELPLLPSIPALSKINEVIQEARGSMTLRDQLHDSTDGLNHESLNVRYMVASELSKLLNTKREDVTSLIAGEAVPDLEIINALITSLLRGCGEESRTAVGQRLKLVCADCLGALGAVDPAKFKVISSTRFKIECSDDDLIFELIHNHLARAFRAASDTIVQDSAALAIQELLKLAGCQASVNEKFGSLKGSVEVIDIDSSDRGQILWNRFSNYVKDIIAPCLTSRLQLPNVTESAYVGPIYRPSMSFSRWIYSWIKKLTVHATGVRYSIFSACRGIVRHDMPTARYLLPYLVLNAICHGTQRARESITEEILSVLNAAASENSSVNEHGDIGGQSEVCIQAIFTLLDNLGQWVDDLKQEIALTQSQHPSIANQPSGLYGGNQQLLEQCNNVTELLTVIPKVTLAKASFQCNAHARALMYFESHVREISGSLNPAAEKNDVSFYDEDISFLMEIYSNLDEPDGLSGLANLRTSSRLQDQLLISEKAGNWAQVLTFCEQELQMEPSSVERHSEVLNCLLNMCHLQAMVTHVDGLICRIPQYKKTWCMQGVQAAWRLGRWDLMDDYLSGAESKEGGLVYTMSENNSCFDIGLSKIIQAMMAKDHNLVAERIVQSKQALLVPLAAAGMDSYMRAYPYVVKLHMLRELDDFNALLGDALFLEKKFSLDDAGFSEMIKDWDNRIKFTQSSIWTREPLIALHRLVFSSSNLSTQVGNCWLQYAKLCRSAGHYETAHRAILEAGTYGAPNVHIEKAKLLWCTKKTDSAIAELQKTLLSVPIEVLGAATLSSLTSLSLALPNLPSVFSTQVSKENQDVAKTMLLYTRWIHYTGQKPKEEINSLYSRVRDMQPKWEKGYFFVAKYCDDLVVDSRKRQEENQLSIQSKRGTASSSSGSVEEKPWWSYLDEVLLFYAKGLNRGHKHLFQALPRLLTLWFEFGSIYHKYKSNKTMKTYHNRVQCILRGCLKDLPTYQWLTVLPQLVSRICHQNEDVVRILKHIITSVLQVYPQQALWTMAAVSKSTVAARRDAAAEIISAARRGLRPGSENNNLFVQFASLVDHLIKLCFHSGPQKSRTINISTEFSALKRMMPLGIILPVQQALTVTLPSCDANLNNPTSSSVFSASDLVTISGIADEAEILNSLQRPKKVVFLGSDGIYRPFLCKPKDDLRKDARMMEFTATINRLLSKFPESRRRNLYIRTFAVIPLTEDCGMVEWVPHTRALRHILQDIYITQGKFDRQKTNPIIKKIYDQSQGKISEEEMLKTKILPMFPPVFHKWFLMTFSEPVAWFRARLAYAHTAAVWSVVGHIVGLGDRHGENILFDSTSGDCVHVDFSCLFDKGLLLEKPELVPFRLTQNMIDGLGISGYEGIFLKVCEITLLVLRTHRETLMSVLETFIHDPLVEWTKSHKLSGIEVENPHAQRAISNIKARLQGIMVGVGAAPSLPLAVEGQARRLIAEAVSHKNLGKMYIWWMAWF